MALADLIATMPAYGAVVCGADEAGRGSYAGPLVVAAVRLRPASLGAEDLVALERLDDSKRLSPSSAR